MSGRRMVWHSFILSRGRRKVIGRRFIHAALLWTIVSFLMLSMQLFNRDHETSQDRQSSFFASLAQQDATTNNENIENTGPCNNTLCIQQYMSFTNRRQRIRNLDRFDLKSDASAVVIVVQVHNRSNYLQHLVNSLRKVRDVSTILLIFSHDYYSTEINEIVLSIDFCLVRILIAYSCLFMFSICSIF